MSCVECRRRKVKCDRTYPVCQRCVKGGIGDTCVYVSHTGAESSVGLPTPEETHRPRAGSELSWAADATQYEKASARNETASRKRHAAHDEPDEGADAPQMPSLDVAGRRIAQLQAKVVDLETMVYSAGGKPWSNEAHLGLLRTMCGTGSNLKVTRRRRMTKMSSRCMISETTVFVLDRPAIKPSRWVMKALALISWTRRT